MNEELSPQARALVGRAETFARDVVAPQASAWEIDRRVPLEALRQAADLGLAGLLVPAESGGADLGALAMSRVMETLAAADMAFAFALVVHNNLAGSIARNGTAAQRRRYLPAMLSGECIGAFLLTEPQGGSDAAAITTRARRDGEGWVLDGEKAWVSNGTVAEVLSVYAQTDPDLGWRGIACFLVDGSTPGVVKGAPYAMLGGHALGAAGVHFVDCRLPADALFIGPGEAFRAAMRGIDIARIVLAAMCCGMLRSGLETALEFTAERRVFGQRIADFQGVQWLLAEVATEFEAARLLADAAALRFDAGEEATLAAAHAKKFASRAALEGLSECMQVMGAAGYTHDHPLARHLAGAKMAQYLDGATEIQNVVIARALMRGRGRED